MALKPRSKTIPINNFNPYTPNAPYSPVTSPLSAWGDDQPSIILSFHTSDKKDRIEKPPELTSRVVIKTYSSRNELTTLPSTKNNNRIEHISQISRVSTILVETPNPVRKSSEPQNKPESVYQSQTSTEPLLQPVLQPKKHVVKRAKSICTGKRPPKVNQPITESELQKTWRPIRSKVVDLDPRITKPEPNSNHSSPRPIKKDIRKIRQGRESVQSYNTESLELQGNKWRDEDTQEVLPRIIHNKVPGGCFKSFYSTNQAFARKTYLGISRMVTNGPGLCRGTPIQEGTFYNTGLDTVGSCVNVEEKSSARTGTKICISKLLVKRDIVEENRQKRYASPVSVRRMTSVKGEEYGSKTERTRESIIKMPYNEEKPEPKVLDNASLWRLKDKVKRDTKYRGSMKTARTRSKGDVLKEDQLMVLSVDSRAVLTTLQ